MSQAKIGRFTKKQIFELPDGTHRLEPHLYIRVRSNGRYRNYFFRFLDPKGRVCDLALGSASKKPLSEDELPRTYVRGFMGAYSHF